jgi:hypothetical protein
VEIIIRFLLKKPTGIPGSETLSPEPAYPSLPGFPDLISSLWQNPAPAGRALDPEMNCPGMNGTGITIKKNCFIF